MFKLVGLSLSLALLMSANFAHALQVINYHDNDIKVELMDCETYKNYGFPSSASWFKGDISRKAQYLHTEHIRNGYYTIAQGSNIPKKLCVKVLADSYLSNGKSVTQSKKAMISTYDTCTVNVLLNESDDEANFMRVEATDDCHAKDIK